MIGLGLTILRMEIEGVGRKRVRIGLVVDVVIERIDRLLALVGHGDAGMSGERHGEEAVEALDASHRQILRMPAVIFAEAKAEKIADGGLHAGSLFAVPIDAQHDALEVDRARCPRW